MAETETPQNVIELATKALELESVKAHMLAEPVDPIETISRGIMLDRDSRAPDRDALASAQPEIKGLVAVVEEECKALASSIESFWCMTLPGSDNRLLAEDAERSIKRLRTALAPSVAEPTPPPVAEGMVLVPDELTGEMWVAARKVFADEAERYRAETTTAMAMVIADCAPEKIYAAMLAATPNQADGAGE